MLLQRLLVRRIKLLLILLLLLLHSLEFLKHLLRSAAARHSLVHAGIGSVRRYPFAPGMPGCPGTGWLSGSGSFC